MFIVLNTSIIDFSSEKNSEVIYNPKINPTDFTSQVANKYFTLIPGKKMIYESIKEDGKERIEILVLNEKKIVQGIETTVVWDRVFFNDELIEDTKDRYAQDKEGNVWYFGEDSKEMLDGKITSYAGSWESGKNGAKAGIIMKANPKVGEIYRQEYYEEVAEDMAQVVSLQESVAVPFGNFENCLKTRDWNPLEKGSEENKYYCEEVAGLVLEVNTEDGEKAELINIEDNSQPEIQQKAEELKTEITEQQAREIALKEVPGKITDITIEIKFGKISYVVEIDADNGLETDVIIDVETGEILGIET